MALAPSGSQKGLLSPPITGQVGVMVVRNYYGEFLPILSREAISAVGFEGVHPIMRRCCKNNLISPPVTPTLAATCLLMCGRMSEVGPAGVYRRLHFSEQGGDIGKRQTDGKGLTPESDLI